MSKKKQKDKQMIDVLQKRGMIEKLKSDVRSNLISKQHLCLDPKPLKFNVFNAMIAKYLEACGYNSTLLVFIPNAAIPVHFLSLTTEDFLSILHIEQKNEYIYKKLTSSNEDSLLSKMLSLVMEISKDGFNNQFSVNEYEFGFFFPF